MNEYYSSDMVNEVDDFLEHHGIKGMHWGIRRTPEELGYKSEKKQKKAREEYEKAVSKVGKLSGGRSVDQLSKNRRDKISKQIDKANKAVTKAETTKKTYDKKIQDARDYQSKVKADQAAAEARRQAKENLRMVKQAQSNAKKQERIDKEKTKLVKKGDLEKILAKQKLFTTRELDAITNDIYNRELSKKKMKNVMAGKDPNYVKKEGLDRIQEVLTKTVSYADTAINVYDRYKKIKGIFDGEKEAKAQKVLQDIVKSNNIAKVYDKRTELSTAQMQDALKRMSYVDLMQARYADAKNQAKGTTQSSNTSSNKSKIYDSQSAIDAASRKDTDYTSYGQKAREYNPDVEVLTPPPKQQRAQNTDRTSSPIDINSYTVVDDVPVGNYTLTQFNNNTKIKNYGKQNTNNVLDKVGSLPYNSVAMLPYDDTK